MDPASIIGLIAATAQITQALYNYGSSIKNAKEEIRQLCSELFALKGALEHAHLIIDSSLVGGGDGPHPSLISPMLGTPECGYMIATTSSLLEDILNRLRQSPGRLNSIKHSVAWPLKKDAFKNDIRQLERLKLFFVLATTSENMEMGKRMYLELCNLTRTIQYRHEQQDKKDQYEFRQAVHQWLAPYDPSAHYEKSLATHEAGTGDWFLNGPFSAWLLGKSPPFLWLRGKPGVGKTTLMSAAIHKAMNQASDYQNITQVFFYCSFSDISSQDPVNVFGSMIAQICSLNPELWPEVDDLYRKEVEGGSGSNKRPGLDELERLLKGICKSLPSVFIFLDAPNESKESAQITAILLGLLRNCEMLRLMVSSTEEFKLPSMDPNPSFLLSIGMDSNTINNDISDYVESWLRTNDRLQKLPSALKDNIRSKLSQRAEGMFRWVQCQLETLVTQKTTLDIKNALNRVPSTLEQTYTNILMRIPLQDRQLAKAALFWLTFSIRALSFKELCEAVIVDETRPGIDKDSRLIDPDDLLKICSSLISYDTDKEHIVLAHSSVWAYLTSDQIKASEAHDFFLDEDEADRILTCKCVSYLSCPDFQSGYCDDLAELFDRSERYPLLRYSTKAWPIHARHLAETERSHIDPQTQSLLLHFFETFQNPRGGNFGAWVQAFLPAAQLDIERSTPLYYASRFSLNSVVKMILATQGTADLEVRGGRRGSTPLHCAAAFGNEEVVRTLLAAGADVKEINEKGETGLFFAVRYGRVQIARLLLDAGADPGRLDGRLRMVLERMLEMDVKQLDRNQREKFRKAFGVY